ncbi:MAG: polysaccharide deacetylase family protein [Chthoniobacterales bacterium]|nr:polysaccharide deacetylase family protein [Chthoniobacterales bacterium]
MLIRFALLGAVLALNIPGCKKSPNAAPNGQGAAPSPAATAPAAPVATPAMTLAKPTVDQNAQVIIYGYHRFEKTVRRPDTEMTPEMFEAQMKELQDKKIPVIAMQDFFAWKRGEKNIPPRAAIITLDDGWKSQYKVGWPILKKYGYPFTLFIYTEGVKGMKFGGGAAMSWEQLGEMRDAGVDIEAHSATHQDLRKAYDKVQKKKLNPEEYEQWLTAEIIGSKQLLEQKLGIRVNSFAVPFGYINDPVREFLKKAGYEAIFTVYGQRLTYTSPNDSLGRYLMEGNKPKVFSDAATFSGSASGGAAPVAEISSESIQAQPASGETAKTAMPLIQANLSSMGPIDPGTAQMRVSGLGVVTATFDEKTQTISYQPTQKLRDKSCTVIIGGKSGEKKVEASWTFSIADAALAAPPTRAPAAPSPAASPAPAKK